jgi:hypothetical protein
VNSEGSTPSKIKSIVYQLGFTPTKGNYDFVYDWKNQSVEVDNLVNFADQIHASFKGHNVVFKIETI